MIFQAQVNPLAPDLSVQSSSSHTPKCLKPPLSPMDHLIARFNLLIFLLSIISSPAPVRAELTTPSPPPIVEPHHYWHDFSCGRLYYRSFHLDQNEDVLYVGAMNHLFRLHLSNINRTHCSTDSVRLEPTSTYNCITKGKSDRYECQNHIRVIQPIASGQLYVCGTNAHNPRDWMIASANLSLLPSDSSWPGIGSGVAKCPFNPEDNATAVWVKHGNPAGLPALYSGSVADFNQADAVIFRTDLYDRTGGQVVFPFKRTLKYDSKWLDKPNFVGSFDIGEHVYFFFRENAVEYINCGKAIYSRVARVCKHDTGGNNMLHKNWASYLKARLNCSIPGEFPYYFNEIQSVYRLQEKFYAVFTTSANGLVGSAVCSFTLAKIEEVFQGKFKEQITSSSAWLPVLSTKVPEPRPGTCVEDTKSLPDSVLNFIRSHPLMDSSVRHDNHKPVYYKRDVLFTRIVVDWLEVEGMQYVVYYIGTDTGQVYKLVEWYDASGESNTNVVDVLPVTTPDAIRVLEISPKWKSLYISSDLTIRQLSLSACKYESCARCSRDPYCGWDKPESKCRPYARGLIQDPTDAIPLLCETSVPRTIKKLTWGQSVHLPCAINSADIDSLIQSQGELEWFFKASDRSKMLRVQPKQEKFLLTSQYGLVITTLTDLESGRYDCRLGPNTLYSYAVYVEAKSCTASTMTEFRKVYADWCSEFQKYKKSLQKWQEQSTNCYIAEPKSAWEKQ